tara:strand:- start:283 stop:936 length:654 start_codon:yes stop_codon:yes gene_type:complete
MVGLVAMIIGLTKIPLSVVGTVTQASPILVAAGAVIFFKEVISWRRWTSIFIGFVGVVLVIQPGGQNLDYAVIWAVVALIAFSIRDLVTRLTPPDIPSSSIATFTMIAAFPFTTAWVFLSGEKFFPPEMDWAVVSSMIILGSFGYLLLITSLRLGELSAIMPFRYSRIVFLLILGFLVFGERPTASMLIGATLILISGVYIMWREKVVKSGLNKTHT